MRNTLKVAKWEVKRNMKNKSFIIGLFITPIIIALFMIIPSFFTESEPESVNVFINDELNIFNDLKAIVDNNEFLFWELHETALSEEDMFEQLNSEENAVYFSLTESTLEDGNVTVYTSNHIDDYFMNQIEFLEEPLRQLQLKKLGFSETEVGVISRGISFHDESVSNVSIEEDEFVSDHESEGDFLERIIPGALAGIILFSIVISGMMIFQSASQEKKDKIAEIILSSVTPNELMQGKIIGYFVLGIVQVFIWIAISLPAIIWKFDIPIFEHLFVPELVVLLFIAVLGYLLFASIFVGIGATIEDVSTSGNFQGMVLMLPFIPFMLIGPVISDPSGIVTKIAGYIPFTSPGVLLIRLSMLEEWPWVEIIVAIVILIISVWVFIKLAGKIFKTGILMYGKNASPKEIWKWLRA